MSRKKSGLGADKNCEECGSVFYCPPSQISRRRYCDSDCQRMAVESRTIRVCAHCRAVHQKSPSIVGKYCGWKCYKAERLRRTRSTCAVCDKSLVATQAVYCSRECILIGRTTIEERPCEVCRQPFKLQPYEFGKRRVCGKTCADELKRIKGPGARFKRHDGYIAVYYPMHPDASKGGIVLEHRLVMEQVVGRRLTGAEEVNHINHVRDDNRPENLEILARGAHARESTAWGKQLRLAQRVKLAEYERLYGPLTSS